MPSRLGIDVGGTHTDFLLFEGTTGRIHALKTPSTPDDPLRAIQHGLEELMHASGIQADEITDLVHGTTLPVNLVLERKGAKVGLLVTRDFEQVLHLARGRTPGPLTGWMHMDNPEALADLGMTRGSSSASRPMATRSLSWMRPRRARQSPNCYRPARRR